jgi:hypothetical protein
MTRRCRSTVVLAAMALVAAGCAPAPRPGADQKVSVQLTGLKPARPS